MENEFETEIVENFDEYESAIEPITKPEPEKPKDMTHIRYGYNPDGSIRWIERNSAEFVEILGKPDLKNRVAKLIADVDKLADEYLDSAVFYPVNGKSYKPKWADTAGTYWGLLQLDDTLIKKEMQSVFPMVIKDATQLPENFVTMTRAELENLINYLVLKIQENYNDKTSLIGELREIEKALETCVEYADFEPLYEHYRELQEAFDMRDYVDPNDVELSPEPEPEEILEENENSDTIEENQEISENENQ
jgi:hypothetical protein